jgi:hypothetical protein
MAFGVAGVSVGFLFALAGVIKIIFPAAFRDTLTELKVTGRLQLSIRVVLPALELATGLAILTGMWASVACWAALGLLVFFVVIMWRAVTRGEGIPCACFGGRKPVDISLIVRNVVLGAYASAAAIAGRPRSLGQSHPAPCRVGGGARCYAARPLATGLLVAAVRACGCRPQRFDLTSFSFLGDLRAMTLPRF